jgi:two-component system sensor histidine kinase ChvG
MAIILDDVERLNRLISDISDASRLDAELSRAEMGPVDIAQHAAALADLHEVTKGDGRRLKARDRQPAEPGSPRHRGPAGAGLRNLIGNARLVQPARLAASASPLRATATACASPSPTTAGHPAGQAHRHLRPLLFRAPRRREIRHPLRLGLSISKQIAEAHGGRT